MMTKSDQVRLLVEAHRYKDALKIVKDFRMGLTQEQRVIIGRAWESYQGPGSYLQRQMKRDPEQCRMEGIRLLKELYGQRPGEAVRRTA